MRRVKPKMIRVTLSGRVLIAESTRTHPYEDIHGSPALDSYGYVVRTLRRGRGCRCKLPCQAYFLCMSSHHRGSRATPFCCGCADDEEIETGTETCDICWSIRERNRKKQDKDRSREALVVQVVRTPVS